MAQLQTSGAISLNEIHQNIGGTSGTTVSLNDTDVKELIFRDSYQNNSMNEYYGAFWHKNTITLNCGLCSYTKTYAPGTIYQTNYTRSMQGWSDVQPIVDTQVTSGTGPVAFGSLTDNSDYGRSIRLNGGSMVYLKAIFTDSGVAGAAVSQAFRMLEDYTKSKRNHASPPATYRDVGSSVATFAGDATEPVAPVSGGGFQVALNNTTAGREPWNTNTNYTGGKIEASVAASSSSPQGVNGYADRKGTYGVTNLWGSQNNQYSVPNYINYTHLALISSTGDWFNASSGNNNTGYPRALPHTGQCTITFSQKSL